MFHHCQYLLHCRYCCNLFKVVNTIYSWFSTLVLHVFFSRFTHILFKYCAVQKVLPAAEKVFYKPAVYQP